MCCVTPVKNLSENKGNNHWIIHITMKIVQICWCMCWTVSAGCSVLSGVWGPGQETAAPPHLPHPHQPGHHELLGVVGVSPPHQARDRGEQGGGAIFTGNCIVMSPQQSVGNCPWTSLTLKLSELSILNWLRSFNNKLWRPSQSTPTVSSHLHPDTSNPEKLNYRKHMFLPVF